MGAPSNSRCASSKKKTSFGFGRSPTSGRSLPELGQHPEQERGIETRLLHQLVGRENADDAAAVRRDAHEILDVERGLAEELPGALLLEHEQAALNGADRGGGHVAVLRDQLFRALGHVGKDGAEILEVEDRDLLVGGDAEGDVEDAFLHLRQLEHAREQQRSHVEDGGTDGMAVGAEHVPENGGIGALLPVAAEADFGRALDEEILGLADGGDAGQVTFDIGGEDRDAGGGEALGQDLQRDRLAGAGCAGDQAMPVGEAEFEVFGLRAFADEDLAVLKHRSTHCLLQVRRGCQVTGRRFLHIRTPVCLQLATGKALLASLHAPTDIANSVA